MKCCVQWTEKWYQFLFVSSVHKILNILYSQEHITLVYRGICKIVMLWHILLIVIYFTQRFIYLRASKTYISLYFSNYTGSNHGVSLKLRFKSTPPNSNNIPSEHWIGLLGSLQSTPKTGEKVMNSRICVHFYVIRSFKSWLCCCSLAIRSLRSKHWIE